MKIYYSNLYSMCLIKVAPHRLVSSSVAKNKTIVKEDNNHFVTLTQQQCGEISQTKHKI
jgi:hypothetical protein